MGGWRIRWVSMYKYVLYVYVRVREIERSTAYQDGQVELGYVWDGSKAQALSMTA